MPISVPEFEMVRNKVFRIEKRLGISSATQSVFTGSYDFLYVGTQPVFAPKFNSDIALFFQTSSQYGNSSIRVGNEKGYLGIGYNTNSTPNFGFIGAFQSGSLPEPDFYIYRGFGSRAMSFYDTGSVLYGKLEVQDTIYGGSMLLLDGSAFLNYSTFCNYDDVADTATFVVLANTNCVGVNTANPDPTYHFHVNGDSKLGYTFIDSANLQFSSGYGIDFSNNSNYGGATSEILDDYEYGNISLTSANFVGWTTAPANADIFAKYIKIGKQVTVHIVINKSTKVDPNDSGCTITGMPFSSHKNIAVGSIVGLDDFSTNMEYGLCHIDTTTIHIDKGKIAGGSDFNFYDKQWFSINITYLTS